MCRCKRLLDKNAVGYGVRWPLAGACAAHINRRKILDQSRQPPTGPIPTGWKPQPNEAIGCDGKRARRGEGVDPGERHVGLGDSDLLRTWFENAAETIRSAWGMRDQAFGPQQSSGRCESKMPYNAAGVPAGATARPFAIDAA